MQWWGLNTWRPIKQGFNTMLNNQFSKKLNLVKFGLTMHIMHSTWQKTNILVGNGLKIKFLFDMWCGNYMLKNCFSCSILPPIQMLVWGSLGWRGMGEGVRGFWRNLSWSGDGENGRSTFMRQLSRNSGKDRMGWKGVKNEIFSIKPFFLSSRFDIFEKFLAKQIWHSGAPLKFCSFGQEVAWEKIWW